MREVIDFLSFYQPEYADVIRGLPRGEIQALEDALGRPLLPAHRDFLETAGANLGFVLDEASFATEDVLELVTGREASFPEFITPLAADDSISSEHYFLDAARSDRKGDGMVVLSVDLNGPLRDATPYFSSLQDLLTFRGFREVRMLPLQHRSWVAWELPDFENPNEAPQREELEQLLENLNLQRLDRTSGKHSIYDGEDCAALVFESFRCPVFAVMFAAATAQRMGIATETACDNMRGHGIRRPW